MNSVILQGNLTHEPTLKYLDINGKRVAVCSFSMATHRHFKRANGEKNKETTFIDCEAWDTGAETISKYTRKGMPLLVRGSLKNDSWEDKEGRKISKIRLRVEEFELPPKKYNGVVDVEDSSESQDDTQSDTQPESQSQPSVETSTEPKNGNDIPF